ncbi:Rha family transcriptional regulator [Clostridium sp.]|uniref:Rha family transcriptional regulator n=1 Tax=Clostridium sp. TaxID=1506 RepID=UPI003217E396
MQKQIGSKLSSREVTGMMEVAHGDLLKKIDGINEDLKKEKIPCSKYWTEGTYKQTGNGKENREFQITKRGCEFLAHKTTGTKGNLFTDKYMDRFEQMKEVVKEDKVQAKQVDTKLKEKEIEARLKNAKAREANIYLKIADRVNVETYKQICYSKATEILNDGQALLPLPIAERKTYSATEIGKELGISANKVGSLAKANNFKTEEYGKWFHDKSKYSSKEVESFRYYDNVIPVLKNFI